MHEESPSHKSPSEQSRSSGSTSGALSQESFGDHLAQLRRRRGLSQRRLAELLCAASGTATVSRHEVSRWERGLRTPARPWLAWLAHVLQAPMPEIRVGPSAVALRRWRILRAQLRAGHRRRLR